MLKVPYKLEAKLRSALGLLWPGLVPFDLAFVLSDGAGSSPTGRRVGWWMALPSH